MIHKDPRPFNYLNYKIIKKNKTESRAQKAFEVRLSDIHTDAINKLYCIEKN